MTQHLDYTLLFDQLSEQDRKELRDVIDTLRKTASVLQSSGTSAAEVSMACACLSLEHYHQCQPPLLPRQCVAFDYVGLLVDVAHQWCHLPSIQQDPKQ